MDLLLFGSQIGVSARAATRAFPGIPVCCEVADGLAAAAQII
jgi:hypothetical protein